MQQHLTYERWFSLAVQTQPRLRACDDHNDSADRISATVRSSF